MQEQVPYDEVGRKKLVAFFHNSRLVSLPNAEDFASRFTPLTLAKHDFLLIKGKINDEYLFLEDGFMRSFAYDTEGNEITTGFFSPGQVVFEVNSFFNRVPSKEFIQALSVVRGWYIPYTELNRLFHEVPEFRDFGRQILVRGFSGLKVRMLSLITETAEERYAALMHSNPEIFSHAPLKTIASFLGITDTSLSRIRKDFSRK